MAQVEARYDVSIGDVHDAAIVIGDHATVVTHDGAKIVRVLGDAAPRLRAAPSGSRPQSPRPPIGRDNALELARRAGPGWPLQLLGGDGIGKTTVIKHVGARAPRGPVIYTPARRQSLDDVQARLFRSFWEAEERFVPAPDQMRSYLADREALVVLDDLAFDRDDMTVLLDAAPRCTFVVASSTRSLWETGAAHELRGLSPTESVQLLERRLARTLGDDERVSAEVLGRWCDGHPQTLVEIAAAVLDRRASLEELARAPRAAHPTIDELSPDQRRLLEVLGSLSGGALGADHVGALAGVPNPDAALAELERLGWVKSQSPRYRLVRPVTVRDEDATIADLAHHLGSWARSASTGPDDVAAESEAIEGTVEHALSRGRPDLALGLAQATETKLAISGLLGSWHRVLSEGLTAVRTSSAGLPADEAYLLHQLGSRAIGVGDGRARQYLLQALEIRERLGDERGAALTRHNLAQLGYHGNGRRRPHPRRRWWIVGILLLLLAGAAAAVLAAGDEHAKPVPVAPKPAPARPPVATISSPVDGAHFYPGEPIHAEYSCKPAAAKCTARVDTTRVHKGELLPTTIAPHVLFVRASEGRHRVGDAIAHYTVIGRTSPTPTRTTPPPPTPTQTHTTEPKLPRCGEGIPMPCQPNPPQP